MVLHLIMNVNGEFFSSMFSGVDAVNFAWLKAVIFGVVAIGIVIWAGSAHLSQGSTVQPEVVDEPVAGV